MPAVTENSAFARRLLPWFRRHGRHDLPWQQDRTPYRVWIAEIMLQQTQVGTVIPYYRRFMERFPGVDLLARAPLDEVLHLWSGLGYYARARNLHRAAGIVMRDFGGCLPEDIDSLTALPGIGRSTAGAILALASGQRHPILDGNVKRVLCRYHAVPGWPGTPAVDRQLWALADRHTPGKNVARYTQAIMDLGATICTRREPRCSLCPVTEGCKARRLSRQHEFPAPRPRKTLPVRKAVFAILENSRGEILLEQRPPAGLWGGLWSFPECPPGDDLLGWIVRRFDCSVVAVRFKPPMRHAFSHFHLEIMPAHVHVIADGRAVADPAGCCWYKPEERPALGMAAPVQKILRELAHPAG